MNVILRDMENNKFFPNTVKIWNVDSVEYSILKDDLKFNTVRFKVFGTILKNGICYRFHRIAENEEEAKRLCQSIEDAKDEMTLLCEIENVNRM